MKTTKEEIDNRIEWIAARTELSEQSKEYIHFQMIDFAKHYHKQQVKNCDLADVVEWLPFNEENASHYNRLAKEGKLIKLYDTGEQRHVNDDNFPMAVVTHYREG